MTSAENIGKSPKAILNYMKFHVLGSHTFIIIGRALKFYMRILHEIPFLGRVNRFALSRIVSPLGGVEC